MSPNIYLHTKKPSIIFISYVGLLGCLTFNQTIVRFDYCKILYS